MAVLHGFSEHAAFSRAAHSIQNRFKFFILNSNIIQKHGVLRSNKQMRLFTGRSYCKASNRQIDILQDLYFIFSLSSQITSENGKFEYRKNIFALYSLYIILQYKIYNKVINIYFEGIEL